PYSMDLRTRALRDSDAGMPSKEVAAKYSVSRAWVDRVKQRRRERGEIAPRKQTIVRRRALAGYEDQIIGIITARPDATLVEIRYALRIPVGLSTLWREIDRLGFRVKKTVFADEQRRADVAARRRRWQDTLTLHDARGYVFIDESGVTT